MKCLWHLLSGLVLAGCLLLSPHLAADEVDRGLLAHWPWGGAGRDACGNGHHAQVHGRVDFQAVGRAGAAGTAAGFNGHDAWLEVPASTAPPLTDGEFSISVWMHT